MDVKHAINYIQSLYGSQTKDSKKLFVLIKFSIL